MFTRWLAAAPRVVRGSDVEPYDGELAVTGDHNRRNAAVALAALEAAGVARADAEPALAAFSGAARRLERRGEANGIEVFDDYAHHPTEVAAALAALRDADRRLLVLFQPHLYSRTRHLAWEFGEALAAADVIAVADVYPAREEPVENVSGKLIVDALSELRPGVAVAWTPRVEDGATFLAGHARAGDRLLTLGAGDVDRAVPLLLAALV